MTLKHCNAGHILTIYYMNIQFNIVYLLPPLPSSYVKMGLITKLLYACLISFILPEWNYNKQDQLRQQTWLIYFYHITAKQPILNGSTVCPCSGLWNNQPWEQILDNPVYMEALVQPVCSSNRHMKISFLYSNALFNDTVYCYDYIGSNNEWMNELMTDWLCMQVLWGKPVQYHSLHQKSHMD